MLSIGNQGRVVRPEDQAAYISGMVASIARVAPEARGCTLVVIVEGQGDWGRSTLLSQYAREAALGLNGERRRVGDKPFFGSVVEVRDPKTGFVGVSQTPVKKDAMVKMMTDLLEPNNSGLWFHPRISSQDGKPETIKDNLTELQTQLKHFKLNETPASKAAPGLKEPTRFYSGKADGKDDILMALMMLLYEGWVFKRSEASGRVATV